MVKFIKYKAFTLVELMVVLAIIALLLSLVTPRYFISINRSREAALRHDLSVMREAIGHFYGDQGRYPQTMNELVQGGYLRALPIDPLTGSAETWNVAPPPFNSSISGGVYDVTSGAQGLAADGTPFSSF